MDIVQNISKSWTISKYKYDIVQHLKNMCTYNGQCDIRITTSIIGINEEFGSVGS